MKVNDLKKELEVLVKELILKILKDFDLSRYQIYVNIFDRECIIYICNDNTELIYISYKSGDYICSNIYAFDNLYSEIKPSYKEEDISGKVIYTSNNFLESFEKEPVKLLRVLNSNKEQIELGLKNILE